MKYYAGIGSRRTPPDVLRLMTQIAAKLEKDGWILRSGGADGADRAFEAGVSLAQNKEIYLATGRISQTAWRSVDIFHPYPRALKPFARALMARNYHQITGKDDNARKSAFVLCWTPDGCKTRAERTINTGGTGQAISIANSLGIEVFNLANPADRAQVEKYVNS